VLVVLGFAAFSSPVPAETVAECKAALAATPEGVSCRVAGVALSRSDFIAGSRARFFFKSEDGALLAHLPESELRRPVQPGDRLEISGEFYLADDDEFEMRVESLRRLGAGPPPEPRSLDLAEARSDCCQSELVRTQGVVRDSIVTPDRVVLLLGPELLRVYWASPKDGSSESPPSFERGALVEATGISRPHSNTQASEHQIRLRSLSDAVVLRPRPLLSPEELRLVAVVVVILAFSAAGWIFMLRRTVRRKTAHIRQLVDNLEDTVARRTAALEETNQRLAVARDAAERANRTKSEFLANISHELRSPMHLVIGYAELMIDDPRLDAEQKRKLETMLASGEGLVRIVDDLLDFSKMEADRLELEAVEFDPTELAARATASFEQQVVSKGLKLHFATTSDVPTAVVGDPTRLRQVLVNLLDNAVRFTDSGEIDVRMDAQAADEPDAVDLSFVVRDTGIGIPPDRLDSVFESFTQADSSTTREYGGTGLGLAICRGLVESMGGRISIESEPPVGTQVRFHVRLKAPLRSPEVRGDDPATNEGTASNSTAPSGSRGCILIADDLAELRELLAEILEHGGYRPILANGGKQAIEQWRRHAPDLILMDIQMPGMSGVEAAREIRRLEAGDRYTPILALTANAAADQLDDYLGSGMDGCITKPIARIENLYKAIDIHLAPSTAQEYSRKQA